MEIRSELVGDSITLRLLRAEDFEPLLAAASDPLIWEQHPDPERYRREIFKERFFDDALSSGTAYVILENATRRIIGSSRYYDWQPEPREVAIGYTFLIRSHWGGGTNRELKRLMLEEAARWARVAWFHIAKSNVRSCRAIEKIGARLSHEGTRMHGGKVHEYAFYRIELPAPVQPTRSPRGSPGGVAPPLPG